MYISQWIINIYVGDRFFKNGMVTGEKFWMNKTIIINNWTVFKQQFHNKMFIWQYRWNLKQDFRSHWKALFFRYFIQLRTNIEVQVADAAFSSRGCESNSSQFTINTCFKEINLRFHCLVVSDLLPFFPE